MPHEAKVYKIFVASPSDVKDERRAIVQVIHAWNAANATATGSILEPVLWETHSSPEMGDRPQAIINRQLVRDCDILVGVFWTRLGTQTGDADSGTVEEIEEFIRAGKPVFLYFSLVPVAPDSVDQDQYKRLLAFRKEMESRGLISRVASVEELREKFYGHLTRKMHELSGDGKRTREITPVTSERENDVLTARRAKSTDEQIRLGLTPNLLFDLRPGTLDRDVWFLVNLGMSAVNIQAVYVELLNPADRSVVGRGLLKTDERILLHWKGMIGPNQQMRVLPQRTFPSSSQIQLSGLVRLVFYFVYGPTGARTHALDVKITMAGSMFGSPKLHDQTIRLDEKPPQLPPTSIDQ